MRIARFLLVAIVALSLGLASNLVQAQTSASVVVERTKNSVTTLNPDGTYTLTAYQNPINYWDGNSYHPIDNRIVDGKMTEDSYTFRLLQSTFNEGQVVEFSRGGYYIRFQPMELQWTNDLDQIQSISMPQEVTGVVTNRPDPSAAKADREIGEISWADAYGKGRNFKWITDAGRLHKVLELTEPLPEPDDYIINGGNTVARLSFTFAVSSDLDIVVDGQSWDKKTKKTTFSEIQFMSRNETLWRFLPARCWDSNDEMVVQTSLRRVGNDLWVDALVPYEWLSEAVYPVYIDPTISAYSSTADGKTYKYDSSYSTARTATSGSVSDTSVDTSVGQYFSGSSYYIYRSYFFFGAYDLPTDATITSASVHLYGRYDYSNTEFYIRVQNGQPTYPHSPLEAGDYYYGHYSGQGAQNFYTTSFTTSGYNTINLNSAGISWIQKGSGVTTKLCFRSSRDINGNTPSGNEEVRVYTADETGTDKDPYLEINYTAKPTVDTNACTDVLATQFTANGDITDNGGCTITTRGFHYSKVFDDFEWGSDEAPLDDSEGAIDWTISVAGSSKAEIDTAQHYSGTRSALLYRDGSNHASVYFSHSALTSAQVLSFRFRIDGNGELILAHGNGSYRIILKTMHDVHRIYYYDGNSYVDTGVGVSVNEWHILTLNNVNFSEHTYDIYLDGSIAKQDAAMYSSSYSNGIIYFQNDYGTSSQWLDNVAVWDVEDEDGSFGEGTYSLEITGLDSETTYYVQAFAKNSAGYGCGDVVSCETSSACSPSISLNTYSWSAGAVEENSNYSSGLTHFTITNNSGGAVTITIGGTDMTGGGYTWTLSDTATPGDMICGLKAGLSGGDYTIIVKKTTPYNTLVSGLADSGTQDFGLRLYTPTNFDDGNEKSGTITLTITCD